MHDGEAKHPNDEVIAGGLLWDVDYIKVYGKEDPPVVPSTKYPYYVQGFESGKTVVNKFKTMLDKLYAANGSSVNFSILSDALSATAGGHLVFTFALTEAGDAFWRSALRGKLARNMYWEWERN